MSAPVCSYGACTVITQKCDIDWNDSDQVQCQEAVCDPDSGACSIVPRAGACDDQDPCTIGDTCQAGHCQGYAMDCNLSCQGAECDPVGYTLSLASGRLVLADEAHDAAGAADQMVAGQLSDGVRGDERAGPEWVGFRGRATLLFRFLHDRWFSTLTIGMLVDAGNDVLQPPVVTVEFSDDGQTWSVAPYDYDGLSKRGMIEVSDAWANMPKLPDGHRGELKIDLAPRESTWVRVTLAGTTGLTLLDEVTFGAPASHQPVCHAPGECRQAYQGGPAACVFDPSPDYDTPCDDGNGCTIGDFCYSGSCQGNIDYGAPCDDDNLCTDDDACDGYGQCHGTQPIERCNFFALPDDQFKAIVASDQCQSYACNPATGECETTSHEGQPCNPTWSCDQPWEGPCTEDEWCGLPVYGTCHAGMCDRGTVTPWPEANCQYPYALPPDQCHEQPRCIANRGLPHRCFYPQVPDGTTCNDNNSCTTGDACNRDFYPSPVPWIPDSYGDSRCVGTSLPVGTECEPCATDSACVPGGETWNANLTFCSYTQVKQPPVLGPCQVQGENFYCHPDGEFGPIENVADGTPCETPSLCPRSFTFEPFDSDGDGVPDGSQFTYLPDGTCDAGQCVRGEWVNPNPPGDCVDTTCDPETGAVTYLPKSDGTPCDDVAYSFDLGMQGPDLCTEGSVCRSSRCLPYGDTAEQKYCGVSCSSYSVGLPGDYYYQPESCSPEGYAVGAGPIGPFGPGPLLDGIEAEADGSDPAWVAHSGSPTVLTFRMKRQRDFSDVTLGVLESLADGAFAPTEVVVSFSSDGETWVDDKAFAVADGTLASVPDGERGELTLPIHWIHDAAYDVGKKWSEPDYVRFTLTHAGALYLDDVAFGLPPSTAPACKHARGCDPVLGSCTYDNDPDGSSCDDGNPCTTVDLCSAGTCIGSNEIACSALDECHVAGVCDPATGACTNPNADLGTACGAGREGQCRVGGCVDGACAFSDRDNGTLCDDGNPCTGENPLADVGLNPLLVPDGCQAGVCAGGSATACQAVMAGDVGEAEQCIGSYACVPAWDGSGGACVGVAHAAFTTCDDHDANTANDFCSDVTCRGGYSTCVGVPQTELLNAESGGLVAITQRFQYLYDDRFYLRLGWADGTSVNLPPNAVPTGTRVVIAVESDLWDRAGWYTSGGSYFFGIPGPNQPYAIQPPLPPVPDGTERVWWPVSFQPCELELAEEVPMTLRYNAVTDKPGRTGGPTIEDHNTPGFVVNGWDRRDMYVVHYTAGAPEKILPDRIDPTTGILSFRGSKFGLYAVVVEVPPHAPAGPGDPCATDFDCNDHSLATTDTCTDGHCTYAPSTTCAPPPDQCYAAGVIDPATGACTYAKLTGTSCDDGEACTPVDTCQAGVCVGVEKTCVASDQCHVPGVCIHGGDGTCTNPIKANGVSCDDQNACTTADSCQAGSCTGGPPTVCKALDQCHVPGVCEPATGCPNPAKDDYSACDDGDACTSGSVCLSGVCSSGAPVVCPAADNCHIQATCDSRSGCPNVAKPNGTSCDDNNPCTATGSCQAGVCKNLTPTVCGASDSCHTAGVCDTSTGLCSNPVKADGASCDDADVCTRPGQCQAGVCSNLEAVGCGFDPDDPPAGYRYDSGSGACLGQNGALTCFIDAPHGLVTAYARGLLSDGVKGGLLDDGTWVGIPGDTQITLRASNSRALSTLSIGFGTRTFGTIAAREPLSVSVSFSDDGTTFTAPLSFSRAAGTLPFIADGGRGDVVLDLAGTSGRSARYVRIKTTGISGFWTFIDEIALGAPCVSGGCNPQSGACSVVTAPDGQACGGPGDTCRGGVCSDCSGKGMLDCGGVCVAPSSATGSCLTPSSSACASVADCGSFPWLVASCVAGACTYAPKPCDGADIDNCQDGVSQPDGSCKQTGPVLLWDFEDGKTPLVIDDSGNGNTGEWKGGAVTFAQGIGGPGTKSLSLNPLNRALVTRQLNVPKTDFALSAHFKTVAQNGGIFTQALDGSTAGQATDRSLRTYAGKLAFYIQYPSWEPTCMSTTRVDDGVWHHAVLTCQSGVGCSAYLDGVLQCAPHPWNDRSKLAADGPLGVVPAYAKQYLLVGYTNDAGAFDGQIDQVAYYDRPLSAAEVATVRAGIDTPLQGRNRPTCDGVDRTCGASPVNTRCDDGNQCTTTDSCSAGACVSGPTASCPGGPCNTSACNIATGVCDDTWFPEEGSCDDGDASTSDDRCRAHQCSGTPSAAVTEPLGAPAPPAMQEPMNFLKRLARGPSEEWTASEYATSTCTLDKDCDALEYVEDSGVATLISASSNAMSLPRDQNNDNGEIGNLYVDNAENLPPKGSLTIQSSAGLQLITYDGHTRTQLFNVKGGTGQLTAGKPVVYNGTGAMISGSSIGASLPQAQIVVDNAANFTQRGTVRIRTSAGPQVVSYAGKTATTLTGCSGGTGTIAANTAAIQLYKRRWMMVATVTDTPAAQECDFLKDDAKVFLQHKDQVALPFVSGDQVTVTGTAHWDGTWTLTKVPNSTLEYYLDGAVWSGNASDDNRGTVSVVPRGFVGWQRAKTYHCPNGDQCLNADAPCSGGGVCSGTVVPHQFNTSGPVFFYTSPELYKRGGQRSSPDEINILTSVSDFTVNTGVPLTAASRLSIPMPRQKFAAGWNFDPPFVAAGIAPGSQLKSLNAPLQNERGYIFGSLLAGINIFIPGLAKPMPIGAQVSLVVDPADPAFYMAIQPPPGFETTWLSGAFGFSAHGELRHTAAIPLWNGKPLPLGTQFSDAVNADKRERIVNPANIFLNVKKAFQAPQMPVLMYINGTLSMYWGNDAFPINWEALSSPGDSTLFSNSPQRVSGLVEAELGLFFQPKIGAVKIPLSLPLGRRDVARQLELALERLGDAQPEEADELVGRGGGARAAEEDAVIGAGADAAMDDGARLLAERPHERAGR
ncbi:MAG: LamG domain-containing protein [Myxococcota bacterium]